MNKKELAEQILKKHLPQFNAYSQTVANKEKIIAAIIEAMEQPPLCDDILDGMDRDDLEVAYRKLRDSNSIYCKAVMDKHNEILELRRQVEAMGVQPGMRWVKASERLPEPQRNMVIKIEGEPFIGDFQPNGKFLLSNFGTKQLYRGEDSYQYIEWLEEAIEPKGE